MKNALAISLIVMSVAVLFFSRSRSAEFRRAERYRVMLYESMARETKCFHDYNALMESSIQDMNRKQLEIQQ